MLLGCLNAPSLLLSVNSYVRICNVSQEQEEEEEQEQQQEQQEQQQLLN